MKISELFLEKKKEIEFNKELLTKPYSQYIKIGGLAEKIFFDYCEKNGLNIIGMGEFSYRLLLYGKHITKVKTPYPLHHSQYERSNFKKKKIPDFMSMFSKEQLKFLEENYQSLYYGRDDKKTIGLPDFFVWNESNNFAFIEIKSGSSVLSKKQREVLKKLIDLFPVYICHIAFDVILKDLEIKNIDFGFISVNEKFEFGQGGLVERSLYFEAH